MGPHVAALATVQRGLITCALSPPGLSSGSNLSACLNVNHLPPLVSRSQCEMTLF